MEINKKSAQGLPLNTIVIALLVVVVLVVIVLAFTTNIGNFNNQVSDTGGGQCNAGNPAIATIYGSNIEDVFDGRTAEQGCPADYSRVPGVGGDPEVEGSICCVLPDGGDEEDNTANPNNAQFPR